MYLYISTNNILKENLTKYNKLTKNEIEEIIQMTTVILCQNYFIYDDKNVLQSEGLSTGSPLSCIMFDITLGHTEN